MEDVIRKMSDTAPRDSRQPGCPEWCYQTLNLLAMGWQSYELNVERLTDYYESICMFKAWEKIPVGKPYGSKEALLKAELGIDDEDFYKALAKKVTANKIRDAAEIYVRQSNKTNAQLAEELGVSERTISYRRNGRVAKNSVRTQKVATQEPRKRTRIEISHYTKPTTAAQKIRATFGDEFSVELGRLLLGQDAVYNDSVDANGSLRESSQRDQDFGQPTASAYRT